MSDPSDSTEATLLARATHGPLQAPSPRFQQILTVPFPLQHHLFRWQSEFDLCDRTSTLGQALDTLCTLYCHLLTHLTKTSQLRTRFLQAPTEHMVVCMYYCDRSLDGIVHAIAEVRRKINTLNTQLTKALDICTHNRDAAEKMYREVEADARPDLKQFIEERKAKAGVFREFAQRIQSVLQGGDTLYTYFNKPWCKDSPLCTEILRPSEHVPASDNPPAADEATPTPEDREQRVAQPGASPRNIPETPEPVRMLAPEAPITQTSSPRKGRTFSERKRNRERRDHEQSGVKRSLLGEKSLKSLEDVGRLGSDEAVNASSASQEGNPKRRRVEVRQGSES